MTVNEILASKIVLAGTLAVLVFVILIISKRILWRVLGRAVKSTGVIWGEDLLNRLNAPVRLLVFFLSFLAGLNFFPELVEKYHGLQHLQRAGFILIFTWSISRVIGVFLRSFLDAENIGVGSRQFILTIVHIAVWALGFLGLLDTLGISITPIIASLGVGSLAVALALQDTLGNFFAGIYIYFDQPIQVGDYVRIEDGSEGYIKKIGWRSTHIQLGNDNVIVMPNTKMSNSVITNYDLGISECNFTIPIGVAYGSDLARVEAVTVDCAKKVIARVDSAVSSFDPQVRYTAFADSSINFNLSLRVKHKTNQGLLVHEMIKAIHETYAREKIDIPFPQRVIHVTKADVSSGL